MVWRARLSKEERAALAWSALKSLDPENAVIVAEAAIGRAGHPLPPFLAPMDEARWWSEIANRRELKAYCAASFDALSKSDQDAFISYARRCVA